MAGRPNWADVMAVVLVFIGLVSPGIIWVIWREVGSALAQRRRDQGEAEAIAAEGFPPPGPPTADQPPAVKPLD